MVGELVGLQTGKTVTITPGKHSRWRFNPMKTAIAKSRVTGSVVLLKNGLNGDEQADRRVHGGPDKAVCVYAEERYRQWADELVKPVAPHGSFGENFTVRGFVEEEVCIGDVFSVGDAVVQCSQPRQPCSKLARYWGIKDFVVRVNRLGWTGWYFRVLKEGRVAVGDSIRLSERRWPGWTVACANHIMLERESMSREKTSSLASCPALSESWRKELAGGVEPG